MCHPNNSSKAETETRKTKHWNSIVMFLQKHTEHTYMTTLCNAYSAAHAARYLTHVHYTGHTNNLKHSIVVCRPHKLVIVFLAPRIWSRPPAAQEHKQCLSKHCLLTSNFECTMKIPGMLASPQILKPSPSICPVPKFHFSTTKAMN